MRMEPSSASSKVSDGSLAGLQKQEGRILTYTGSITLEVPENEISDVMDKMYKHIEEKKGFLISRGRNHLNAKIPASDFIHTFNWMKTLGEVRAENIQIQDITEGFYDSKVRLDNALKLQKRLLDLLEKAKNVQEAVEVEKELSRVTEKIETLKAKLNLYQKQIDYSELHVYLREKSIPGPLGWVFVYAYKGIKWFFVWE